MQIKTEVNYIIGSGALGSLIFYDINQNNSFIIYNNKPVFPIFFMQNNKITEFDQNKYMSLQKFKNLNLNYNINNIYIAIPNNNIQTFIINILLPLCLKFNNFLFNIFFCNNGLLKTNYTDLLNLNNINIFRILVYVGVNRKIQTNNTSIIYNGGHDFYYKQIYGKKIVSFKHNFKNKLINFIEVIDMQKQEYQKFFINFIFAFIAGNQYISNLEVFNSIKHNDLVNLACLFSHIFQNKISSNELIISLKDTANNTANNINSITKSRLEKNNEPWRALCSDLLYLLD